MVGSGLIPGRNMIRKSAPRSPGEAAGGETRLKLLLLAFALALVALYSFTVTEMGEQLLQQAGIVLHSDTALLAMAATGAAVAIAGLAFLLLRGRSSKGKGDAEDIAHAVANIAGRQQFLARL